MRDPRPFESADCIEREDQRNIRIGAIHAELRELVDSHGKALLTELFSLLMEETVDVEDRVLRIAGHLCQKFEAVDLWKQIYAAAMDGSQVKPGDELTFLQREWALNM